MPCHFSRTLNIPDQAVTHVIDTLKVGDVRSDDGTITADIVTVDNSLVQRLRVDRHTGAIEYQN